MWVLTHIFKAWSSIIISSISRIDFFTIVIFVGLDAKTAQNKEKEI